MIDKVPSPDGISQAEAMTIAQCYSDVHLGSGKISTIEDRGDHWLASGKLGGYVAKPLAFSISKSSGGITSNVGPSYEALSDFIDRPNTSLERTRDR